jgi:NADPH:quinone reductase-like Zn-dependent oxidoreductase
MALPPTMRAVRIHAHGDPSVLRIETLPLPEPAAGEALVRLDAVSINHLDLWVRRGIPGVRLPIIPGCDGAGEVVKLGPMARGVFIGQKVVIEPGCTSGQSQHDREGNDHLADDYQIRGEHCDGLDREYVALDARYLVPLPPGLDSVHAAALPLVFLTAWGMVVTRARVQREENVLVIGGSSGVGSAAVQIAKQLGARVIATGGSEPKRALARELGADEVVDHSAPGWARDVKRLTGGRGADVVVEHVGPATWEDSLRSLARNGRLVTCGATTGPTVELALPHLFIKNQSILGSTMGPRTSLPIVLERAARGVYRAVVDRVLPLARVAEAHALLEERKVLGKIVLTPGG